MTENTPRLFSPDPAEVDRTIGAAPTLHGALDRLEDALAAGVPIGALLVAQADRMGGTR
jgi:hypothetical protein